jgi:ABC-type lipoprotein export system ATPase subunit
MSAPGSPHIALQTIEVIAGRLKDGRPETTSLMLKRGECYSIVGKTGSGKSRLIKDIEQLAQGDTVSGRTVLINGVAPDIAQRMQLSTNLIAHLGQNMRFVLDMPVQEFVEMHCAVRKCPAGLSGDVITLANRIANEPISPLTELNVLSGGQTRALMIADIALVCDSPIVLIDEIENAGIDKALALDLLTGQDKLVLIVTHDVHTALMAPYRIVIRDGGIHRMLERSTEEQELEGELMKEYRQQRLWQERLRDGQQLAGR